MPSSPCEPIRAVSGAGLSNTVTIGSTLTNGFEIGMTQGPPVGANAGALVTAGGQFVNLYLLDPTLTLLNGGATPPVSNMSVPVVFSGYLTLTAQMVVIDGAHPDGFRLSAANTLVVNPPSGMPASDDTSISVVTGAAPIYGPATIPFYGVNYSVTHVNSNGRVMWGGIQGSSDWSPTVSKALTQQPAVGVWADFSPNLDGIISMFSPAPGFFRVTWNAVPYFGNPTLAPVWYIELDAITGAITISGLNNLPVFPVTPNTGNDMWIGISNGSAGPATDPGPTPFAVGGPNAGPPLSTDMIYQFGQGGTLAPGVSTLIFLPNANGNYDWVGI